MTKEAVQALLATLPKVPHFKASTFDVFCGRSGRPYTTAESLVKRLREIEREGGK